VLNYLSTGTLLLFVTCKQVAEFEILNTATLYALMQHSPLSVTLAWGLQLGCPHYISAI
jgi:hypothetical protein